MKQGISVTELAQAIQYNADNSNDFVVSTLNMRFNNGLLEATAPETNTTKRAETMGLKINDYAHGQIAQRTGIPKRYYDTLRQAGNIDALDYNVNYWFKKKPENRMVRTIGTTVRAFLSDKYRRLDNKEFAETIFPIIHDNNMKIESSEITEQRMYIKALMPTMIREVKVGDPVQYGITLSNSEVGAGSLKIEPMIMRLVCKNGLISNTAMRKYHVGKSGTDIGLDTYIQYLSEETRRYDNKAFWMKVKDIVNYSLKEDVFNKLFEKMQDSTKRPIETDPTKVITRLSKSYTLTDDEGEGILNHLARGGEMTQWGLTNAVTRYSQDVDKYDRATFFEKIGGNIVTMGDKEFAVLAR